MATKITPQIKKQFLTQLNRDIKAVNGQLQKVSDEIIETQRTNIHRDAIADAKQKIDKNPEIGERELKTIWQNAKEGRRPLITDSKTTVILGMAGLNQEEPDPQVFLDIISGKAEVDSLHNVKELITTIDENGKNLDKAVEQSTQQAKQLETFLTDLKSQKKAIIEDKPIIGDEDLVEKATQVTTDIYKGLGIKSP